MLIGSIGRAVKKRRPSLYRCFITRQTEISLSLPQTMQRTKRYWMALGLAATVLTGCNTETPTQVKDPEGTLYYTESKDLFPNPERGFLEQVYYESGALNKVAQPAIIATNRKVDNLTLYLHSYYLTDYMESDIAPEFLDRLARNMEALREGGAKAVVRFSYKSSDKKSAQPWDATPEWMAKHIDQIAPYLEEYKDVILCMQAGFIGSWGEWYYTSTFPFNPSKDEDFVLRWELVDHLLEVLPEERQLALRTPGYKMRYLKHKGQEVTPLSEAEAYQNTAKARLCGHNDCFVASANDVGTYFAPEEKTFWAEDTKYTFMGGETCGECYFSTGENAIKEMTKYHWTYINRSYHSGVLNSWISSGHMNEIKQRLGYRLVLDKAYPTQSPKAGELFSVVLTLRNVGFAAPINPRDVEMVLVSAEDNTKAAIYKQEIDPRYWQGGDTIVTTLHARLDSEMTGDYKVYLNLPDPMPNLHSNPDFSIRLANKDMWEAETGYNYLMTITLP